MSKHYVWRNGGPVETDLMTWAREWENPTEPVSPGAEVPHNHCVAYADWPNKSRVSTVFLGIDYSFGEPGGPVLFETMIFWRGHELDEWRERYRTRDEALAGHAAAVALVMAARGEETT